MKNILASCIKKPSLMVSAVASAVVLGAVLAAPTALATGGAPYCEGSGGGLCGSDKGDTSNGAPILLENSSPGSNQNVYILPDTNVCDGGVVLNDCPFNSNANNTKYYLDEIVYIENVNTGKCWTGRAGTGGDFAYLEPCSDSGTAWVGVPQANGSVQLVSVYLTNQNSNVVTSLYGDHTVDDQVQVSTSNASNWANP